MLRIKTSKALKQYLKPVTLILAIVLIDQVIKIWIKTNMYLGQEFVLFGEWAKIHFTENKGMAFGMSFGDGTGKLLLSLFRIVAVTLIGFYLYTLIRDKIHKGLVYSIALVLAGAIGNIIDSVFYGVVFSDSINRVAEFLPAAGGYSDYFHGKVVDMFYFPILQGYAPDWVPFLGGEYYIFFRPVFNFADAAITVGVFIIIVFQKSFFAEDESEKEKKKLKEKAAMEKTAVTIQISGKVQGVFFRKSTQDKATELGLKGYVQNLEGGTVFIEALGLKTEIDQLIEWCKQGPENAEVENVTIENLDKASEDFSNFEIRH